MKLSVLYEDRKHKRIEQAIFKYLSPKRVKALKKLNRASNIKPSGERRAFGFGGGSRNPEDWVRDPDFASFLQGVKPVWGCARYHMPDIKTDSRIQKLKSTGDINWHGMDKFGTILFYWTEFEELVLDLVRLIYKLSDLQDKLPSNAGWQYFALQAARDYILGMLFGYNEDMVLNHIGRYVSHSRGPRGTARGRDQAQQFRDYGAEFDGLAAFT